MAYHHAEPRRYATITALKNGETIELDGIKFKALDKKLESGDFYIAERNGPPQLLECREIHERGWVSPVGLYYCFNPWECVPVEEVV